MKKYKKLADDLVSMTDAKKILGVSSSSVIDYWVKKGRIKFIRLGNIRLFLKSDISNLS